MSMLPRLGLVGPRREFATSVSVDTGGEFDRSARNKGYPLRWGVPSYPDSGSGTLEGNSPPVSTVMSWRAIWAREVDVAADGPSVAKVESSAIQAQPLVSLGFACRKIRLQNFRLVRRVLRQADQGAESKSPVFV